MTIELVFTQISDTHTNYVSQWFNLFVNNYDNYTNPQLRWTNKKEHREEKGWKYRKRSNQLKHLVI